MNEYIVKVAYGDKGKSKNTTQNISVMAESDSTAMILAVNKFKTSNSAYRDKDAIATEVKLKK